MGMCCPPAAEGRDTPLSRLGFCITKASLCDTLEVRSSGQAHLPRGINAHNCRVLQEREPLPSHHQHRGSGGEVQVTGRLPNLGHGVRGESWSLRVKPLPRAGCRSGFGSRSLRGRCGSSGAGSWLDEAACNDDITLR